ncbi:hypothetical protein KW823_24345, partial [Enterobacter quasiroggenkampii]|nr:hypothetical protein [Enterobacter quasiroggenkampii]
MTPEEELSFKVVPISALSGEGSVEMNFDFQGVTVLPDRESIWNAIQDPLTSQYQQVITVKTLPAVFDLPPGQPEKERLSEIVVELKRSDDRSVSIVLTPEKPEVQVSLLFPIADVMLRRANNGEY